MPELPEVEVIRRELEPLICGKTFAVPVLHMPTSVQYPSPDEFIRRLAGRRVDSVSRKGKYLIINLGPGALVVHLRMTGNLLFSEQGALEESRFLRVSLPFTDASTLYFSDMRRFGRIWLIDNAADLSEIVLKRTGPDIYTDVARDQFLSLLSSRKRAKVKALLLDQRFVAGMGNIYTDECLYRSGIHPRRAIASLNPAEADNLYSAIQSVLEEGIVYGGTSFRDYRNAQGAPGEFQNKLSVYGRKGSLCRCGASIQRTIVAGRGTYFCPQCQQETVEPGRED